MKKVNRKEEPDFWKKYKKIHSKECYADLKKSVQGNILRRDMRDFLLRSQYGLCAYCCRRINLDNSLIEHIKPQVAYPKETMNYGNLIASCKNEGENATCGVYTMKNFLYRRWRKIARRNLFFIRMDKLQEWECGANILANF